jgi:hypothetical protein
LAATSASSLRRRRAPTANAGPASSTTSSTSMPPSSGATGNRDGGATISGGISLSGGGSSSTARDSAEMPAPLSRCTSVQASGRGASTIQVCRPLLPLTTGPATLPCSAGRGGGVSGCRVPGGNTVTWRRSSVGSSTRPTIRQERLPRSARSVPPTPAPTRLAAYGLSATSSAFAGARPSSWTRTPRASGSV